MIERYDLCAGNTTKLKCFNNIYIPDYIQQTNIFFFFFRIIILQYYGHAHIHTHTHLYITIYDIVYTPFAYTLYYAHHLYCFMSLTNKSERRTGLLTVALNRPFTGSVTLNRTTHTVYSCELSLCNKILFIRITIIVFQQLYNQSFKNTQYRRNDYLHPII